MRILFRKRIIETTRNVAPEAPKLFHSTLKGLTNPSEDSREPHISTERNNLNQFDQCICENTSKDSKSESPLVICHATNSKLFIGSRRIDSQTDEVSQADSSSEDDNVVGTIQSFDGDQNGCFGKSNYNASGLKAVNNVSQQMKKAHTVIGLAALTNMIKITNVKTKSVLARRDQDPIESTTTTTHNSILHAGPNSAPDNGVSSHGRNSQTTSIPTNDRVREAKLEAERAVRDHKVFAVLGPYNRVRQSLRMRGWVEKIYRSATHLSNQGDQMIVLRRTERTRPEINEDQIAAAEGYAVIGKVTGGIDLEDENSTPVHSLVENNSGEPRIPQNEESNGYYELMSRLLRYAIPNFIWCLRKSQVDFRHLRREQIINHHHRAPFTTKVGLCRFLSQIRWVDQRDCDHFFPRCFVLSEDDDKQAFIDDFRLTACMSLIKLVCLVHDGNINSKPDSAHDSRLSVADSMIPFRRQCSTSPITIPSAAQISDPDPNSNLDPNPSTRTAVPSPDDISWTHQSTIFRIPNCVECEQSASVPFAVLDMAIARCKAFLGFKCNQDIDLPVEDISDKGLPWDDFFAWYYKARKSPELLMELGEHVKTCRMLCERLSQKWPQFALDGTRNIWIVKPGAKSRGRGIVCYDKLDEMLTMVQTGFLFGEARFVVQKYIENPLLIYKTKFDIRQWFLVTDWAPLTVWWYKVCYLRFCSQEFTLDDFSEAVHLSNNSIQHKYGNGPRSSELPEENMWYLSQFQEWLSAQGHPQTWKKKIEPAMKRAIIDSLLCTQEAIEVRKNSFGLYGADFLLTEDFKLWLIEINASPCMAPSTSVTAKLASEVLEDTIRVVLDRRNDRNCDVGQFELIYRQAIPSKLIYTGVDLRLEGIKVTPTTTDAKITNPAHSSSPSLNRLGLSTAEASCIKSSKRKGLPSTISETPMRSIQDAVRVLQSRPQPTKSGQVTSSRTLNPECDSRKPIPMKPFDSAKLSLSSTLEIATLNRTGKKTLKAAPVVQKNAETEGIKKRPHVAPVDNGNVLSYSKPTLGRFYHSPTEIKRPALYVVNMGGFGHLKNPNSSEIGKTYNQPTIHESQESEIVVSKSDSQQCQPTVNSDNAEKNLVQLKGADYNATCSNNGCGGRLHCITTLNDNLVQVRKRKCPSINPLEQNAISRQVCPQKNVVLNLARFTRMAPAGSIFDGSSKVISRKNGQVSFLVKSINLPRITQRLVSNKRPWKSELQPNDREPHKTHVRRSNSAAEVTQLRGCPKWLTGRRFRCPINPKYPTRTRTKVMELTCNLNQITSGYSTVSAISAAQEPWICK